MKSGSLTVIILFIYLIVHGQQPVADFSAPTTACIDQKVNLTNLSTDALRYEWDLCQGDLSQTPTAAVITTVTGSVTTGLDLVFDGTKWFGFVTSRETNSIIRLDFGTDINSIPAKIDLGNIGSISPWRPIDIHVVFDSDKWFAFVYGESTNLLTRLDFGSSLETPGNLINAEVIVTGNGNSNCGLDVSKAGGNWLITYTNTFSINTVFLDAIDAIPAPADQMNTGNIPGASNFGDIKMLFKNNKWYAYAPTYGNQSFYRFSFGTDPLMMPIVDDISGTFIGAVSPFGIDIGVDLGNYIVFLSTIEGPLIRIDLGSDLDAAPIQGSSLGNLGQLANTLKVDFVKHKTEWIATSITWNTGEYFKISFPAPQCASSPGFYETENVSVFFPDQGVKFISLRSFKESVFHDVHRSISVGALTAPSIEFENLQVCGQGSVNFTYESNQPINTINWNFGDGEISSDPFPIHYYAASGDYLVKLYLESSNGCANEKDKWIKIYDAPVASFALPSGLLCTNNEFTFINTTSDNFDGYLSYAWFINDLPVGTDRDLKISFTATGIKSIKLLSSIPGCSNEITQSTSNVQAGPVVDFSFIGNCASEEVQFTTNISEPVTSQTWDFNDGNTSTDANPVNTFVTAGEYSVSLLATSTNGCNNSVTKPVVIYSLPVVDFSIPAPPLSCTGSSTQFANLTANPPDGTITTWLWNFDDAAATENTSSLQDPSHTFANAGSYDVTLTATTEEGCSGTLQKAITIEQSPSATVESSVACKSLPVNFTATGTDLQSYYWEMGTSYYTEANPTHTFSVPGDYQILLTVQGNNNCETTYERFISVPVPLEPDFSVLKNCVDHQTEFTDITLGADPVAQQEWDFDGLATATGSSVVYSFNSLGSKSITLKVTAESGCSYSINRTIEIAQAPTANFDASPEVGAMPLVVRFTNTSTDATQHEWTFGDAAQGTSNEVSPSYTFQDTGEFMTELKASNNEGCESTATKLITVVAPLPDVDIRRINVSENPDGSMQVIITLENKGNTFLENLPVDVDISGKVALREVIEESIAPAAMYNLVLSYSLTQLSGLSFLCASTTLANDLVPEGNQICIELDDKVFLFSPYPNPVKNDLELTWIAPAEETVTFTLVDAFGKTVLSSSLSSTPGLNRTVYDVSHLGSGIYILTLKAGSASKTQRIVISREN